MQRRVKMHYQIKMKAEVRRGEREGCTNHQSQQNKRGNWPNMLAKISQRHIMIRLLRRAYREAKIV